MAKMATVYVYSIAKKVDWRTILKKNNVPNADRLMDVFDSLSEMNKQLDSLSVDKVGNEIKSAAVDQGKELLQKAKGVFK